MRIEAGILFLRGLYGHYAIRKDSTEQIKEFKQKSQVSMTNFGYYATWKCLLTHILIHSVE